MLRIMLVLRQRSDTAGPPDGGSSHTLGRASERNEQQKQEAAWRLKKMLGQK